MPKTLDGLVICLFPDIKLRRSIILLKSYGILLQIYQKIKGRILLISTSNNKRATCHFDKFNNYYNYHKTDSRQLKNRNEYETKNWYISAQI